MARYQFKFWLDANKDDELLLAEEIDLLKRQRTFTATVRDGIRLIVDLRAGRLDVLFEMFPWVQAQMKLSSGGGGSDIETKLSQIEKMLMLPGSTQIMQPMAGPKPLNTQPVARPVFDEHDDDLLIVRKSKDAGTTAAENFLRSVFALEREVRK